MISPETLLYIYELHGDLEHEVPSPPRSFVGLWNEEEFAYLFFTESEDDYVRSLCREDRVSLGSRHEMKYEDWQTGLPDQGLRLAGIHFVRLTHPSPPPGAILMDPTVVFGDGNHPTTAASLEFIRQIIDGHDVRSMLDLGTGTGILSLAAAALGVGNILAIDKNVLAVRTARQNVAVNDLSSVIRVREGEARIFMTEPYDLVAANLPYHVLRDLIPLTGAGLHGFWVVSGINADQAAVLQDLLQDQGYGIEGLKEDPPWVTFVAAKAVHGSTDTRADISG